MTLRTGVSDFQKLFEDRLLVLNSSPAILIQNSGQSLRPKTVLESDPICIKEG